MTRRRIKVEFEDGEGGTYTASLDGSLSKDKILKLMTFIDLVSVEEGEPSTAHPPDTTFSKLHLLIQEEFPLGSFNSVDLLQAYRDRYSEPVKLNTVSTYLARFVARGLLHRERMGAGWSYRRVRLDVPR